ncbi:hypothetical protein [Cetobacterium sp.]|uniref:hypothetical protein n=1 Tax=Cetobacterium sp. TaxID=2071632 RepID=UPI003EE6F9C1
MYLEKDIQEMVKFFREMSSGELIQDKEVEQIKKISKMIDSLNTGDKKLMIFLDDLIKEILELRDVLSDKYIRIGICLERVE